MILDSLSWSTSFVVVALTGLLLLLQRYVSPSLDPLEPPLLKPRAPLVGHIISMLQEGSGFYVRLFKERPLPISTLPVLNGKLYVINSPDLIHSALRNNDISFDPFLLEFSVSMWGISKNAAKCIENRENMNGGLNIIHANTMGEPVHRLNIGSLTRLMSYINRIKPQENFDVPDVSIWLRDVLTDATATALYGEENPLTMEKSELLWTFDKHSMAAAFGVPDFFIKKATNARRELNKMLLKYYQTGGDQGQGVSELIKKRTVFLRSSGFTDEDLSTMELMLLWVGVTNTAPALFWLFAHVLTNPDYTSRVQAEVSAITTITNGPGGRTATVDIKQLEKSCPFFNACLQETLRLYLHSVGNRRVMQDTKIQDADGRKYLLKKGYNIQWPPSVTHFTSDVWGLDVNTFRPERVLEATAQDEKTRRGSMLSFGGGKNLCPGRKFAQTEMLGFVGVVALGFEVEGLKLPKWKDAGVGAGPRAPDWGSIDSGVRIKKRPGWEDVTWSFEG
ncbi:hypothetical protein KAF25_008704 [Fusarium avenaceum]|uniref:7-alpha-hydroxycholest-4-en-3-one 12-alpha-hydroxylase n=1 Tax=Fusarium avenaceum TaxID=40199 RepID=A0A9P7HB60_9HYPO|nr:hypothetical protein KAF25_008704 [Fusarium avenaceum]